MHTHAKTCTLTTDTYIYTLTCMNKCSHMFTLSLINSHAHTLIHTYMYTCTYTFTHPHIHTLTCTKIHSCILVSTHSNAHTQIYSQRDAPNSKVSVLDFLVSFPTIPSFQNPVFSAGGGVLPLSEKSCCGLLNFLAAQAEGYSSLWFRITL